MANEERNVTMIITFEGMTEEEANKMMEELPDFQASIQEEVPEVKISIRRGTPPDGDTKVSE